MTDSPHTPPVEFEGIEQVQTILRERGHRVSAAGRLVLEALFAAEGPVSAPFIAEGLTTKGASLELTSVYRNLERLEELGIVKHFHLGHGPGLYMLVGSGDKEFLSCERCGRVTSVEPSELDPVRRQIASASATRPASASSRSSGCASGAPPRRTPTQPNNGGQTTSTATATTSIRTPT